MTVSVIVPAYNIAPYIEKCVQSILSQTYKDIQLIIVDDGSTDGTGEICDKLSQQDKRIIVLHQENSGVSSARNAALRVATGKYISCIDGDDWIEPTLYEDAINNMQRHDAQCFMFEYFVDYMHKSCRHAVEDFKYGVINGEKAFEYSIGVEHRFLWPKVFERELMEEVCFNKEISLGEDTLFICEVLGRAKKVVYSPNHYYHYLIREGSAIQSAFSRKKLSGIMAYQKVLEIAERNQMGKAIIVSKEALVNLAIQLIRKIFDAPKYTERKQDLRYLKRVIMSHKKELYKAKKISRKTKIKVFMASFSVGLFKWL